jgi:hypothetical protein
MTHIPPTAPPSLNCMAYYVRTPSLLPPTRPTLTPLLPFLTKRPFLQCSRSRTPDGNFRPLPCHPFTHFFFFGSDLIAASAIVSLLFIFLRGRRATPLYLRSSEIGRVRLVAPPKPLDRPFETPLPPAIISYLTQAFALTLSYFFILILFRRSSPNPFSFSQRILFTHKLT